MIEEIVSVMTVVATLSVKGIGIPSQIAKIHQNNSIENISILHFSLSFTSYVLWTIHGIFEDNWVIIIGQGVGILTSGLLLSLIFYHVIKDRRAARGA